MDKILEGILLSTKVTKSVIETRIRHSITGKKYPKRTFYILLKKYADDFLTNGYEPRMIGLAGLRGTGKTTLMWQIAEYIFKNKEIPVYFFNVDIIKTASYSLFEVLQGFQKMILKKEFRKLQEPIVFLFDEVHEDAEWAKTLKILYDEARTAFIVCTGSSALLIQQTADLARRMKIERVYPFKFIEFITAKSFYEREEKIFPERNLSNEIKNALFFSPTLNDAYEGIQKISNKIENYFNKVNKVFSGYKGNLISEYIKYHNIPSFLEYREKSAIFDSILDLLKRVINEDVPKIKENAGEKSVGENEKILKLLLQLAISDEINLDTLSQKTGIKKDEIEFFLDILNGSEVVNIFNPYGGKEARIWKNKKIFFMSPSIRLSLLSSIYGDRITKEMEGKLYEDIVAMYIRRILDNNVMILTSKNIKKPDFVIETMEKPLLLEVGISKTTSDQFSNIDCRYGILVSNGINKIEKNKKYLKLPLKWFLLM